MLAKQKSKYSVSSKVNKTKTNILDKHKKGKQKCKYWINTKIHKTEDKNF
jgi:hypothetical protein